MRYPKLIVVHPFLFTLYAVIALLARNIEEVTIVESIRAMVICLLLTGVIFLLARLALRDWQRAGLFATAFSLLFFSYGHVYAALKNVAISSLLLGRHRVLGPIWLGLLVLAAIWVFRSKGDHEKLTRWLNAAGAVSLAFPIFGIILFGYRTLTTPVLDPDSTALAASDRRTQPDIYYIILDAYSRDDALLDLYGYDNTPFLDELEDMGFYIAECSMSNYAQTKLSLASSMNFTYIQSLGEEYSGDSDSRAGLGKYIRQGAVRNVLEDLGYSTVAFETGYYWTQMMDADLYLRRDQYSLDTSAFWGGFTEFEEMLVKTSAGLILADTTRLVNNMNQADISNFYRMKHRLRILYALDQLEKLPAVEGPKFVFAHIVTPHKPYIFYENGEMVEEELDDIDGYTQQVAHVNQRVLQIVRALIAESETPPVIIIQGDHGGVIGDPADRMKILNAYYLPDGGDQLLYPSISPVNTFRLVFNHYFNAGYPLLEDVSYFSQYDRPYQFEEIGETRPGCGE